MFAFFLAIVLFLNTGSTALACNERQTDTYVTQILFGNRALSRLSDEKTKMLLAALYLCSEQCNELGNDKIEYLKLHKVSGIPPISSIDINESDLLPCSHNTWEHEYTKAKRSWSNRKTILQNTVNKVFDFGFVNNLFGGSSGKCNSFAALLYYFHILADYLADDPDETNALCGNYRVPAYSGSADYIINGDIPNFTQEEIRMAKTDPIYSDLDELGRCGPVFALLGKESTEFVGPRPANLPDPTGWKQKYYSDVISGNASLYDRSHLIARMFGGVDNKHNLITGTTYLNKTGMLDIEIEIYHHIQIPGNHVLYRVTPIYKGDNLLASGVQIEAYSIEDSGTRIHYNRYCYNVQPGVEINYATGESKLSDNLYLAKDILPFAVYNPDDNNPDLMWEIEKHLELLFDDLQNMSTYTSMINEIQTIANEARSITTQRYISLKQFQYKYFEVLRTYLPLLLAKESFFQSAFK